MIRVGTNDVGNFVKKTYNPAAPDWSSVPSMEASEFLPQVQGMSSTIVS